MTTISVLTSAQVPPSRPARVELHSPYATLAPTDVVAVGYVWTGDCSATVEISRISGPYDACITEDDKPPVRPLGEPPWYMSCDAVRSAIYQYCLVRGAQFDIYRWVNLAGLAAIWQCITLPDGVRSEWQRVLETAHLIGTEHQPGAPTRPFINTPLRQDIRALRLPTAKYGYNDVVRNS